MALGRPAWDAARARLTSLLAAGGDGALQADAALVEAAVLPQAHVTMHLPADVGDYTDFYASKAGRRGAEGWGWWAWREGLPVLAGPPR